jgi:hypothetical protein
MPNPPQNQIRPKRGVRTPAKPNKQSEVSLREQAKTETEERPYLDTQGGE